MDAFGSGTLINLLDLPLIEKLKMHEFTQEKFRHMCILSGCDYLPSIKGMGLITANKLLRKFSSIPKVRLLYVRACYILVLFLFLPASHIYSYLPNISFQLLQSLRIEGKMRVPGDYEERFDKAEKTFLYQLVFDPTTQNLVPLSSLPEGLQPGDLDFAGTYPLSVRRTERFECVYTMCMRIYDLYAYITPVCIQIHNSGLFHCVPFLHLFIPSVAQRLGSRLCCRRFCCVKCRVVYRCPSCCIELAFSSLLFYDSA